MGEFFKGWPRKVGLVTLAMACVLTVAWIRSNIVTDQFGIQAFGDFHVVQSRHGAFVWMRQVGLKVDAVPRFSHSVITHRAPKYKTTQWNAAWTPHESWRRQWQYGIGDVKIGSHEQPFHYGQMIPTPWCSAPYWALVLPLMLLSAWLLLGRSWKAKQPPKTA